jgi:subtilisin
MNIPLINPCLEMSWLLANATGKGVTVAVIDSGVDGRHPKLRSQLIGGCEIVHDRLRRVRIKETAPADCRDDFGHGTAVAGIISDLAPDTRLVSVKVLDDHNTCTGDILLEGIRWALDRKIRLLNLSLATTKHSVVERLFELCERAYIQGSIIVAARRNFGELGCPAMFSSVISVDRNSFPERWRIHFRPGNPIQFDARGTNVRALAPGGGETVLTGTSFATPHVTGIVALLSQAFPHLTASEAKAGLKALSDRLKKESKLPSSSLSI